jgi:hypothetical protein
MEDQKPGGFCVATGVYSNSRSVGIFRNSGPPGSLEFGRPRALYSFFGSRKTKSQTPEINVLVKKPPSSRRQNTYSVPSLAGDCGSVCCTEQKGGRYSEHPAFRNRNNQLEGASAPSICPWSFGESRIQSSCPPPAHVSRYYISTIPPQYIVLEVSHKNISFPSSPPHGMATAESPFYVPTSDGWKKLVMHASCD